MRFKERLAKILSKKENLVKLGVLVSVVVVCLGVGVFTGIVKTPLSDPLTSFQPPNYMPDGYVSVDNNSTDNSKVLAFNNGDKSQFIVAAVKDINKSDLQELKEPLTTEKMENISLNNTNLNVSGHDIIFQTLEMNLMGMSLKMFHASWICPENNLTIITMGTFQNNETEDIQKMVQSIKCHQTHKNTWNPFKQ